MFCCLFFCKQKTAYELRISDLSSDVCSSDLDKMSQTANEMVRVLQAIPGASSVKADQVGGAPVLDVKLDRAMIARYGLTVQEVADTVAAALGGRESGLLYEGDRRFDITVRVPDATRVRSEEHTSELQSLMRISYAVFCLQKKKQK